MVIHLRLQLLLLAFKALDHADFSSFLLGKLMIAVSQSICHVLALLIIKSLCHPQSRVVHLIVMPLLCKLFIILHFEFHDLLRLGLCVIDLLEGPLLLHLQHLDTVSQQLHIFLYGFPHLFHLWVRQIGVFL